MMNCAQNGVITARTMRDTLLRIEITEMSEEHSKMATIKIDRLITRIIQIPVRETTMGIMRGG